MNGSREERQSVFSSIDNIWEKVRFFAPNRGAVLGLLYSVAEGDEKVTDNLQILVTPSLAEDLSKFEVTGKQGSPEAFRSAHMRAVEYTTVAGAKEPGEDAWQTFYREYIEEMIAEVVAAVVKNPGLLTPEEAMDIFVVDQPQITTPFETQLPADIVTTQLVSVSEGLRYRATFAVDVFPVRLRESQARVLKRIGLVHSLADLYPQKSLMDQLQSAADDLRFRPTLAFVFAELVRLFNKAGNTSAR